MTPSAVGQFRDARYYSTGKTKLTLGPFTGGINGVADPSQIADNELVECINYLINPGGLLTYRPSFTADRSAPVQSAGSWYTVQDVDTSGNLVINQNQTNTGFDTNYTWQRSAVSGIVTWTARHVPVAY